MICKALMNGAIARFLGLPPVCWFFCTDHITERKPLKSKRKDASKRTSTAGKIKSRKQTYFCRELLQGIRRFLPKRGLPLQLPGNSKICWTPRLIVICAILMVWSNAQTLKDRFADARLATVAMYSSRRRPGKTAEGFIAILCKHSGALVELVCQTLRAAVREIAGRNWTVEGWLVFAADGTRVECPMTRANEKGFGCAGKGKTTPQQFLTMLLHLGTGLPWAWIRGHSRSSERRHLGRMVKRLPRESMLVADAGFTGYELLRSVMAAGGQFLIRVGSNVRLLKKLGYRFKENDGIVYLWPEKQRNKPPLMLRLIVLHDGKKIVHLLSSVLKESQLSNGSASVIYRRRWGIELYYRTLKQTMGKTKLLSDSPRQARVELDWSVVALWILGLMTVSRLIASGRDPAGCSLAHALRVVRDAMRNIHRHCRRGILASRLRQAVLDKYRRTSRKKARHWPHKKTQQPPGTPKMRTASREERAAAQAFRPLQAAA